MSLVEDLRQMEAQVTRRLQELEPLVAEYQELKTIAERIGSEKPTATQSASATARAARTRSRRATKAGARRSSAKRTSAQTAAAAAKPARARRPASARKPRAAGKPAANGNLRGKRDEDIIRLVAAQPGITVAQVGKQLGVDPTGLYRVVRRLEASGHISKQGAALKPAAA